MYNNYINVQIYIQNIEFCFGSPSLYQNNLKKNIHVNNIFLIFKVLCSGTLSVKRKALDIFLKQPFL